MNQNAKPRTIVAKVTSNRMEKTIVVSIIRKVPHPKYGKYVKRLTKLFAHDPKNSAQIGDTAVIETSRPISKKKHWLLIKIIRKGESSL